MGNVHALIHAVFHLMNHRSNGDLIKLIWYYDIHLLVNKLQKSEQQQLLEWVHASGLSKVLIKALALTAEYFDSTALQSINIKVDSKQSSTEFDLLLSINSKKVLFGEGLNSQKTLKDKWLFIQEMAFPPPAEIYAKYGKDNKQPLVWLYLRRLCGGVIKTLKG